MAPFDIKTACQDALDYYETIWALDKEKPSPNMFHFWQKSNQIHSYIRFATLTSTAFTDQPKDYWFKLIAKPPLDSISIADDYWNYTKDALTRTENPLWTDDFGWGGMACLSLSELLFNNADYQKNHTWQEWRDLGFNCMQQMIAGADSKASKGGSPVQNGISNCPVKATDPSDFCKNTVTNANYFALAMTTYAYMKDINNGSTVPLTQKDCLQSAYNQYLWFKGWINQKALPGNPPALPIPFNFFHSLQPIDGHTCALLDERPAAISPYTYDPRVVNPPFLLDPWNSPQWQYGEACWSGDQGLFFNACSLVLLNIDDFISVLGLSPGAVGTMKNDVTGWLSAVGFGIFNSFLSYNTDYILREGPFYCLYNLDPSDYMCGRGVLSRFLTLNPSILGQNSVGMSPTFLMACLANTSEAIYNSRGKDDPAAPKQVSATWTTSSNDLNAQATFINKWGGNRQPYALSWVYGNNPVWNNYCMMMAFDVYAAFIRMTLRSDEEKQGEKKGDRLENGVPRENGEHSDKHAEKHDCKMNGSGHR